MSVTNQSPLLQSLQLQEELRTAVDERTLQILDRRRRTAVVKRRGWLVRRMLLLADVVGLVERAPSWRNGSRPQATRRRLLAAAEILVFLLTLPAWVVITKLYGLYDHDDERADHSTADDFGGVFHMVTVCTWLVMLGRVSERVAHPTFAETPHLLGCSRSRSSASPGRRADACTAETSPTSRTRSSSVPATSDSSFAKKLLSIPSTGSISSASSTTQPKERREDLEHLTLLGAPERLPAIVRLLRRGARDRRVLERLA